MIRNGIYNECQTCELELHGFQINKIVRFSSNLSQDSIRSDISI